MSEQISKNNARNNNRTLTQGISRRGLFNTRRIKQSLFDG